jgi:hypothetical protein
MSLIDEIHETLFKENFKKENARVEELLHKYTRYTLNFNRTKSIAF